MSRSATLMVCDDIRQEMSGKLIIIGVYTGDILILHDDFQIGQLIFFFTVDCDIKDTPRKTYFEVVLPDGETTSLTIDAPELIPDEQFTRWYIRQTLGIQNKSLRSGKIKAKVICDGEEIRMSAPAIVVPPVVKEVATTAPTA